MKTISCAICNGYETIKILTGRDKYLQVDDTLFTLVRCNTCGLVYVNPQPTQAELSKYYPAHYPSYKQHYQLFSKNRLFEVLRSLRRHLTKKKMLPAVTTTATSDNSRMTALDFGCGSGSFLLTLRREHPQWKLFGFDMAANQEVRHLEEDVSIILDDPNNAAAHFEKCSFDRIYLKMVLEHVNDPVGTLRMLAQLLKDDGEMVIEVPNIDALKFKLFRSNHFPLELPRHLYHFSPKTLGMLCEKCGLTITNLETSGSSKGTVRSIYYALGIERDQLDPILFLIVDKLTKLLGEKRINDEALVAHVKKAVPHR